MASKVTNMTAEEFYSSDVVLDGRSPRKNTKASYSDLTRVFKQFSEKNPTLGKAIDDNIKLYLEGHGARDETDKTP